jgi:hypothetical protein
MKRPGNMLVGDYELTLQLPEVHADAEMAIQFRRTLRVPDDGKVYPLPPSHRAFPLQHVDGHDVPPDWIERGGVMMPLHQSEAMWIAFSGARWVSGYPFAVKIGAGKINVVSGRPWSDDLDPSEDDYIVVPRQPRLDGFCIAKEVVRQFVAMPLGKRYSVAEQLNNGSDEHGGLQIIAYPLKADRYEKTLRRKSMRLLDLMSLQFFSQQGREPPYFRRPRRIKMGLGAGGRLKQPIYRDPYGIDAWDQSVACRCFVTLANAPQWEEITGQRPPTKPPTAKDYAEIGLPWFDYYGADQALPGSPELVRVASVEETAAENEEPLPPVGKVKPDLVVSLGPGEAPRL